MKYKYCILILSLILVQNISIAQNKLTLDHSDYKKWRRASESSISQNGKWITYTLKSNQKSNDLIKLKSTENNYQFQYERGSKSQFDYLSSHLLFTINPDLATINDLRRTKVKKDKLPIDSIGILNLSNQKLRKIPRIVSYQIPEKWSGWLAYLQKDTVTKKSSKTESHDLVVENLDGSSSYRFPAVTDFKFSEKGNKLAYVSLGNDSTVAQGVYVFDTSSKKEKPVYRAKGKYQSITWSESGNKLAFVSDIDTTKTIIRPYSLQMWEVGQDSANTLVTNTNVALNGEFLVSENSQNYFSKDESKFYFGLKPFPILQDTSLLDEEIVNVEVWNYKDQRLHTQQKIEKDADLKKSYVNVIHLESKKIVSLSNKTIPTINLGNEGNSQNILGINNQPYQSLISWEGFPYYNDLFIINSINGSKTTIKEKVRGSAQLSPMGKFAFWYDFSDSAWFTYEIASQKTRKVTQNNTVVFYQEIHDTPSIPSPYGLATWSANDEKLLVYDRFDIWEIDPTNQIAPRNITVNGRTEKIRYRYEKLADEERFITKGQKLILSGFNELDKSSGFYELVYKPKAKIKRLISGPHLYRNIKKAQQSNEIYFTKESFRDFPDFYQTDIKFKKINKISSINPQQSQYKWGDNSLYKWTTFDGKEIEGMLVTPDDFDPNKKYPLLVNFYDKSSNSLHNHRDPFPHRSTINYSLYVSKGYVIFNPDVHYEIGKPGESAYNCVVSGVEALIKEGFIDKDRIGVQGHSWGGYQVAHLVTKTDIFACAEAGAPVPNMISAYGGIRWWTGLSRMFQYEHTQSRIGGTLWEYPQRYIENSPIFFLDKVTTPLLIMHNDADGHVPWYQGIELFVSLRRLGKPSWFLNYQGEPHWPLKEQNRVDFSKRMQQFFDHYLLDAPKPRWMNDGIPATHVGIDQALDHE